MRRKLFVIMAIAAASMMLGGCQTTGKVIQGVGSGISKTGGAVRSLS